MIRQSRIGRCAHVITIVLTLPLMACFSTETEVVTAADAVKLCGNRFVHDDDMAHQETVYTWDDTRRGYMDPAGDVVVRFGHLKGEAYLAQAQPLRAAAGPDGKELPIDRVVYLLMLVRVSPPRLHVQSPKCLGQKDTTGWLAHGYGVDLNESGLSALLTGSRAGILGFFAAGLACEPGTLDIWILPESLTPGGPELVSAAAKYDRGNFALFVQKACDGGSMESCYKLGQIHVRGDGVARDPAKAATLFEKVCAAADMRGCLDLGLLYDRGDGVAKDAERARALLQQACSGGEPYACEALKMRRPPLKP